MVAKAKVRIEGEDATAAAWRSAVSRADSSAKSIQKAFKGAFAFVGVGLAATALASSAREAIDFGDSINKASIKAGIGNKAMSELAYAAKLADVDIASLSTAIKKMQVSLSEAGTGAKGPTAALGALGLSIQEVQKRKPEAQFELLADRISKLTDPADRARAAVEIFGKAGADLLPLFEQGAAGIAKARAEAEKLGLSFSDDQIKKLSEADDSIKRLDASWKGMATTITALVAGPLSGFFDALSGLDSRTINNKIADTEAALRTRGVTAQKRAELQGELDRLKGAQELEAIRAAQTGTSGGPLSRGRTSAPIGFAAQDVADKAAEAAKKAGAAALKEEAKLAKEREDLFAHTDEEISKTYFDELEDRSIAAIEFEKELSEAQIENAKNLAEFQAAQASKLSEGAQIFKDSFLNAWDDMVNNGKFRFDELLKYILAQFARRGIAKLFDSLFTSKEGGGAGLGGAIVSGLASAFGGARAGGGSVSAGKSYLVGEKGAELFTPGASGAITPNHALGGNVTYSPVVNVDARGATMELAAVLPGIIKRAVEQGKADLIQGIRNGRYPLGAR